ncbi:MAG: carboxypeptidase regulatory-like domain-containing protein, partial [Gemmatimonadetes bacterium]|nr:carboxypeptidase regulatory-like domain-containing protein [Gemmatimonadota bacterium]
MRIPRAPETRRVWLAVATMITLFNGPVVAQTGVITGRVLQSGNGTGLADVTVRAETVTGASVATTQTAVGGEYRLAGLAPGSYTVTTSSLGYREARVASVEV